jgi:hypothetical protein
LGAQSEPLAIIEKLDPEKPSFRPSKWPRKLKTAKNSKLPKLPENCFERVGKGGWPPISTWIKANHFPKIDMRKFYGKDPITWILQMEHFFDLHDVPHTQKVRIESLYLEPNQFVWYLWLCSCKSLVTWTIFMEEMIAHYEDTRRNTFFNQLINLKQKGSVAEHIENFQRLNIKVTNILDEHLIDVFIETLKDNIQHEV